MLSNSHIPIYNFNRRFGSGGFITDLSDSRLFLLFTINLYHTSGRGGEPGEENPGRRTRGGEPGEENPRRRSRGGEPGESNRSNNKQERLMCSALLLAPRTNLSGSLTFYYLFNVPCLGKSQAPANMSRGVVTPPPSLLQLMRWHVDVKSFEGTL